jgi:hypothetical protein
MRKSLQVFMMLALTAAFSAGQQRSTGGIKGKVRVESGSAAGVTVSVRMADRELGRAQTNRKGEFGFNSLAPGTYVLTFRKPGLSVGTLENVEVTAGKVSDLEDGLVMKVDEGALAFVRGSVFTAEGLSVEGARVDIARINPDGSLKKIEGRVTGETGEFVFRLSPSAAKYRVTAKVGGAHPSSKDIEVDGASVYRVALSISWPAK